MKNYFNAVTTYRVARYFYLRKFVFISRLFEVITYVLFNSYIPAKCKIGKNTYCSHRGMGVVIHPDSIVGKNCIIGTGVSLGGAGKGRLGAPKIGNNVYLGTGTKVIGPISISDNVITGANSVVVDDINPHVTVVGIPAKEVS